MVQEKVSKKGDAELVAGLIDAAKRMQLKRMRTLIKEMESKGLSRSSDQPTDGKKSGSRQKSGSESSLS